MIWGKKEIRDEVKARRNALLPSEIEEKSKRICSTLSGILDGSNPVMVYVSKVPEVNTGTLITDLLARETRVIVPIIERETVSLRLSYLEDPAMLVDSTFHVPEPVGHEIPAQARDVKVAIIPLLAFDRAGNRLGYGAGYYDRFLAANPSMVKIGIAYACQEIPEVPGEPTDIRMDMIITEKEIIRVSDRMVQPVSGTRT
ncbi:MAG TPA: 5-formyltetrahydrofolate cyclo-ligase [Methanoregula sp.]|nr:5-formyltetrahydrofolate cyclo-ligase [Methanoregula sp.]